MNMHVPQTLESVNELRLLASVSTQIISPQSSSPVIGLVQDSLLGSYLFSKKDNLNLHQMMKLAGSINSYNGQIPLPNNMGENPTWTSHQMLNIILPEITFNKINRENPKANIHINGGHMTSGVLDKTTLGAKNNSLFHIAWNDHGPLTTRDFFDNMTTIANNWLLMSGFSVGMKDSVISDDVTEEIRKIIGQYKNEAMKKIEAVNLGSSEKRTDPQTIKKEFPMKTIELMNKCRGEAEKITRANLDPNNSINAMVSCGSKGNQANIVQVVALLGQQEVEGTWVSDEFHRRTMPHYHKDNLTPESHGFVQNSFLSGLNPNEYWFHAKAGRVGVISRAIKTAETGYIQRKATKALEDCRSCYDGTVRNANNVIIQTIYGNDSFDSTYHETQKLTFLNHNFAEMQKQFKHLPNEKLENILTSNAYELFSQKNAQSLFDEEFNQIMEYYTYVKKNIYPIAIPQDVKCPINFHRLILNTINKFEIVNEKKADIDPLYIIEQVKLLRKQMVVSPFPDINYVSTIILNSLMSIHLSSKNLIYRYKFNKIAFDHLIEIVYLTFMRSLVAPGENVGIQAAQSIGEPATQMTLDTFHHTGLGSKANVSRGVPRIIELFSLTRNPKTPSLTVQILDSYFDNSDSKSSINNNYQKCEKYAADIEYTILEDLLIKTEIHYDENDHKTCLTEDQEFIDSYYELLSTQDSDQDIVSSPWLLRMEFNREEIMNKHIPMSSIEIRLRQFLLNNGITHTTILSDDNAYKLICRIKINNKSILPGQDPISYLRSLEKNLLSVEIKGINGIDKGYIRTVKKDITLSDGTIVSPFDPEYEETSKNHNHLKYLIDTNGSNLLDVLNLPYVDKYNTISNNVWEIYEIYGVEAARNCLINELNEVMEYNGTYISQRHIELLVDVMTNQGSLVSVDRHGVNKTDSGPLHRASFEETTAQITTASIFNEVDQMTGVSGNIMFGQFIPTGTNAFKIAMDLDKIKNQKTYKPEVHKPKQNILITNAENQVTGCSTNDFDLTFKLNKKLNIE